MKRKSVWDEKPLKDLDLLKEVEKRQSKDRWLTKMDIFRELSKKYKKILTPDQFNFRYNYLIAKQKRDPFNKAKEVANSLPSYINDVSKSQSLPNLRKYEIIANELRDNKQGLLDVNKALWEMIDPHKLVKFCDKQLELQQKRKSLGGMKIIFKTLSLILNQKEDTISARYYFTRKNNSIKLTKIDTLENDISRHLGTIMMLEDKINGLEKDNSNLIEHLNNISSDFTKLDIDYRALNSKYNELIHRPLIKLSLFIESIINFIKGGNK